MISEKVHSQIIFNTKSRNSDGNGVEKTSFSQSKIDYRTNVDIYDVINVPALVKEAYINNIENYQTAIEYEHSETHWPPLLPHHQKSHPCCGNACKLWPWRHGPLAQYRPS